MRVIKLILIIPLSITIFSIIACNKEKDTSNAITKEKLVGKWEAVIQSNTVLKLNATLKASGAMELDQAPYDGIPDVVLLWDLANNAFTAHLDANGVVNFWKIEATIDPTSLSMAGQLKADNGQNPPIIAVFLMDKK